MKKSALLAAVLLLALTASGYAGGGKQAGISEINMATGGTGGTYYSFGSLLASVLGEKTRIPFRVAASHGSMENAQLISSGGADIAFMQNDIADHAWFGRYFFEGKKNTNFAAIAALYTEICHIVVNPASGIRSVAGLKGKVVSLGEAESGTSVNARQILEAYGLGLNDVQIRFLNFSDSADALKNNTIDAFFCVGGAPLPAIAHLAESKNIAFLEIDDSHAQELNRYNPYYSQFVIPAGTYSGQNSNVQTLALKAVLVASWKLSDDLVYLLTKSLFESKSELEALHVAGTELDIHFARDHNSITIPFHPGASRYYKEMTGNIIVQTPERRKAD